MNACCGAEVTTVGGGRNASAARRRVRTIAGAMLPGAVLTLLPKCPVCLAGYVAMASGVGISVSTASELRVGVMVACVGALVVVVLHVARGFKAVDFAGRLEGAEKSLMIEQSNST